MDIICPNCGFHRNVSEDKLPARAQIATCPKCRHKFQFRELPASPEGGQPEEKISPEPPPGTNSTRQPEFSSPRQPQQDDNDFWQGLQHLGQRQETSENESVPGPEFFPPWENIRQYGILSAFFHTLGMVLFHPVLFFQNMRGRRGIFPALVFYLIIVEIQIIAGLLLQGGDTVGISQGNELLGQPPITLSREQILLLYPVLLACSQFFVAGLNHLFLNLTGGTEKGFEATFRVVCYGSVPFIFSFLLPKAQFVAATWSLLYIILGYKYVHSVSLLRSTLAVFSPLFLLTALFFLFLGSAGV